MNNQDRETLLLVAAVIYRAARDARELSEQCLNSQEHYYDALAELAYDYADEARRLETFLRVVHEAIGLHPMPEHDTRQIDAFGIES